MGFGDLKTDAGIKNLNEYMLDKSYIEGYVPSQADVVIFLALSSVPKCSYENAARWYRHISFYKNKFDSLPGVKKPIDEYGDCKKSNDTVANDDDDIDLFGSDDEEEDPEAARIKQERLDSYAQKKAGKKGVIAKSNVILDIKPWDDETDMKEMERLVRTIEMDGLLFGVSKLAPVGYGINKLQITCVVEDDKVSIEDLQEKISGFEDFVQSVDIAAFNKI